ncbi:MAG: hydroxyacid dehydrogenase [Paracoccaceae bacterium]|nr:hydroxyacid dehydrogenase [Paracoccaceae bacterium]
MILITEFMDMAAVRSLMAERPTVYAPDLADRQGEIPSRLKGVHALVVRNRTQVTPALLAAGKDIRVIGRLGVGLDNIDVEACRARNVEVVTAAGANARSVAEYVVASVLVLLRSAFHASDSVRDGQWPRSQCFGRETAGRRLGLVGIGQTARETARLARGLGMEISAFDPFVPAEDAIWNGIRRVSLDALLETVDALSLHVPLTPKTRHLINADRLARMRPGSVLINAARGGIVDEPALATALRSGHIAGAALDVFDTEPLTAEVAGIFQGIPNLVLTPHIAGVTSDSNERVSALIASKVLERV